MNHDIFQKYSELRVEKGFAHIRWLMLIATGAFSLSVNTFFSQAHSNNSLSSLKIALTANAIGILLGGISASGEAMLAKGIVRNLADKEIYKLQGDLEKASKVPNSYHLPRYMRWFEKLFYISLITSISAWIYFVWQQ